MKKDKGGCRENDRREVEEKREGKEGQRRGEEKRGEDEVVEGLGGGEKSREGERNSREV